MYETFSFITGKDDAEHLRTLETVFQKCQQMGLHLKREKCEIMQDTVDFLGYKLTAEGLLPQEDKVKAIKDAPEPRNTSEVKSYLGMINYYAKYCYNLAHNLSPLYDLLKKDRQFIWGKNEKLAFEKSKRILLSSKILVHYQPNLPITVTCDASPTGISAILSHIFKDGSEKPVMFASRSLTSAERNYSQNDREGLAVVYGVTKFRKYVYGQHFTIKTDNKPLIGLFGPEKKIPEHCSSRVQRWIITLQAYDYNLVHVSGINNVADALSRLPLPANITSPPLKNQPADIQLLFNTMDDTPLTSDIIARETSKDSELSLVYRYCMVGWPDDRASRISESLLPYFRKRDELSVDNGCVLWGNRVIIPKCLRAQMLQILHEEHIGIVRMKAFARGYVWWPKLDTDIEKISKNCETCLAYQKSPAQAPLYQWEYPEKPWSRIHIDFAGPFLGHMYLIVVDAHSKWIDSCIMNKITADATILQLRKIFATHGLPDKIVSDNGPTFISEKFADFCRMNGIIHCKSSIYHPQTNGLAERAVQTFKSSIMKMSLGTIDQKVSRFLINYRSKPNTTTGVTPAELLLGRKLKTRIDLIHETVLTNVKKSQIAQKVNHDIHSKYREFEVNDKVFVKNFLGKYPKYFNAIVVSKHEPYSYSVLSNGNVKRVHIDHLIRHDQTFDNDEAIHIPLEKQNASHQKGEDRVGTKSNEQIEDILNDVRVKTPVKDVKVKHGSITPTKRKNQNVDSIVDKNVVIHKQNSNVEINETISSNVNKTITDVPESESLPILVKRKYDKTKWQIDPQNIRRSERIKNKK